MTMKKRLLAALVTAAVLLPTAAYADNDTWYTSGGDGGRSFTTSGTPPVNPDIAWTDGDIYGLGCIIADQARVYAPFEGQYGGGGGQYVGGFDRATGAELWRVAPAAGFGNNCPVLASGRVVVNGRANTDSVGPVALALNAATGATEWTVDGGYTNSLISDGTDLFGLLVNHPGCPASGIARIDGATGALDWCVPSGAQGGVTAVADGVVAAFSNNADGSGFFGVGYALADGRELWRTPELAPAMGGNGQLLAFSVTRSSSGVPSLAPYVSLMDSRNGTVLWTAPYSGAAGDIRATVMDQDRVYIGTRAEGSCEAVAQAYDRATGRTLWGPLTAPRSAGCAGGGAGVLVGNSLVVGSVIFDKATGAYAARGLPQTLGYSPAFINGTMYRWSSGDSGALQAVRLTPDTTPPTVSADSPTNGSTVTTNKPTFTFSASDARSGIVETRIAIDGVTTVVGAGETTYTPSKALAEGTHTWSVSATDGAGNVATSSKVTFTVKTPLVVLPLPAPIGPISVPRLL